MSPSDIAAWWGAVIATLVFLWEVYKWRRSGPQLEVSVAPNMETFGSAQSYGKGPFVVVEVRNNGDRKTTVTHLVGFCFKRLVDRWLRRKPAHTFIVSNPDPGKLPHVLEAGERWLGILVQNEELENWSREFELRIGVLHSGAKKPITERLVINRAQPSHPADVPALRPPRG
jgi:hypothetical protein